MVQKSLRNSALSPVLLHHAPVAELTFEQRRRARQVLRLSTGEQVRMVIDRGIVLACGDVLVADDGGLIQVKAKPEYVLRITAASASDLTRAAYHLGNRHIAVEVGDGFLQIEHDSVLEQMLNQLNVQVQPTTRPFNPEQGAYGGGHKHGHDATFDEDYMLAQNAYHAHEHDHGHDHR